MLDQRVAKKRAVNLFVDTELLDEAKRMRINLSELLEQRLRGIVRAEREKRWVAENQAALESINQFIDHRGLLASRLRLRTER
jgi:antitoxin CcdA